MKRSDTFKEGKMLIFWNIAGLRNKDKVVWKFIKEGDFVSLTETWVEEKDIKHLINKLSKKWNREIIAALRKRRKGGQREDLPSLSGSGMLIGVKKNSILKDGFKVRKIDEGLIETELKTEKGDLKVLSVYTYVNIEKYWKIWEK